MPAGRILPQTLHFALTEIALFPLEADTTDDFTDALTGTTAIPLKRRFTQNQGITDHLSIVLSWRVTKRPQVDEQIVFSPIKDLSGFDAIPYEQACEMAQTLWEWHLERHAFFTRFMTVLGNYINQFVHDTVEGACV